MTEEKTISLSPNVCFDTDQEKENGTLEIALPGVKKEDINLRINEEGYSLTAMRGETKFVANQPFCCPVKVDTATAKYENGLLTIHVSFKDSMDDAIKLNID